MRHHGLPTLSFNSIPRVPEIGQDNLKLKYWKGEEKNYSNL